MPETTHQSGIHIAGLRCVLDSQRPVAISEIGASIGVEPSTLAWVNEEADSGSKVLWRQGRHDQTGEHLHVISMIGRQILVQHDLLEHSIKASRQATNIALAAVLVSVAALVATLITQFA